MNAHLRHAAVVRIEPGHTQRHFWSKAWRFRELFFILAWRDLTVRYKQTVLGLGWAVLKPLLTVAVLTIVFGQLARLPTLGRTPYTILVFSGLLAWNLVAYLVSEVGSSLVVNADLIGKVYFPRILIPASTVLVALVDLSLNFVILLCLMIYFRDLPDWRVVFLPAFAALAILCGCGPGLWFAALNVKYRDLRNIMPLALQLGLYVSPVGFSSAIVPERWHFLYSLNPVVGIVDGFRWCLLRGEGNLDFTGLALSVAISGLVFWSGLRRFRTTERTFADLI
jgi:lipopolysaccharide transport system permease protein